MLTGHDPSVEAWERACADANHAHQLALAGMMGRAIVRGGLSGHDAITLDHAVRSQCRSWPQLDLTRAEAAQLAVATIRGYATAHPVADDTERRYAAKLQARRVHREAMRRLRNAAWGFLQNIKTAERAAGRASAEFAHAVHNPVENHSGVIPERPARCGCDPQPVLS